MECEDLDATCSESLSSVTATWQPFYDEESGIEGYQIALGTTPGGGQIKPFFDISIDVKYFTIGGLDLMGQRKVYVSIKGTNGAGLSSVATSNGLFLSYISQGLPPLTHIGVYDVLKGSHGDVNFQESFDTYRASWDVSGDPCPVVKYEWQIQRLDGLVVQEWLDVGVKTAGMNDGLHMKNGELYYSLLRVTNALNYTYIIRSDGVTIEQDPLLPGKVFDGDITGYDLNFLPSKTMVTANWDGFGLPAGASSQVDVISGNPGIHVDQSKLEEQPDNQQVAFYEVAVGTDRRFPKTRDNIVPFTNVGKNTTATFYNLDLVPGTGLYYFTVKASSASYSVATVTSNGFHVGFDGGVTPGTIIMNDYINTDRQVDVQFEGFTSKLDILMYYVAISNNTDLNGTDCKLYIDGGSATEEEKQHLFSIFPVSNINKNTFYTLTPLQLDQGHTYYVYVMGTDKSGECGMTYHKFTVDITPPQSGHIKAGPYYDMPVTYTPDNSTISVTWKDFIDLESDIDTFEVSLWRNLSCDSDSTEELVVDWIELTSNYTQYDFVELELKKNIPYTVRFKVTNQAGLFILQETSPVLFDVSQPSIGKVVDGKDFLNDQVWFSSSTTATGSLLHLASPFGPACPSRSISMVNDPKWTELQQIGLRDPSGQKWSLIHRTENVDRLVYDDTVTIKLGRDNHKKQMFTGALYRSADYENGGTYSISVKAAGGEGIGVTGIMLWDGPEDGIATYDYKEEADWSQSVAQCCLLDIIPKECWKVINCTTYLESRYFNSTVPTASPTTTTITPQNITDPPYHVVNKPDGSIVDTPMDTSVPIAQSSCGIQIFSGASPHIVTWCRTFNDTFRVMKTSIPVNFDPSATFHRYRIQISAEKEEAVDLNWCMTVHVDEDQLTRICGIVPLSDSTKLILHVWNRDNFVPDITDMFNVFSTKAYFKDLVMPPAPGSLCRYGDPFRGGTNPILRYEVGIGSDKLLTDIAPFREVIKPCIPCYGECSKYNCDATCNANEYVDMTFTLNNLDLKSVAVVTNDTGHQINKTLIYFFTVKAVLGSGINKMASSDGFYVDMTSPIFDPDVMTQIYIDVSQGEFTPVVYQASNSTIKAFWRCLDEESSVKESFWAIGNTTGGEELQPFTSVGLNASAINSSFEGILQHNHTYYVSIRCVNGGGQATQWNDTTGVTVLLEPPLVDDINNTIPGATEFPHPVTPSDAKESTDPTSIGFTFSVSEDKSVTRYGKTSTSIGFTFSVSEDKSVTRYDMCIGTSEDNDDIFPCLWVGYNISGSAIIKHGWLYINDHKIRQLSELRPNDNNATDTSTNVFHMEPGRTLFMTMRVCNDAMLCTNKSLGSITITDKKAVLQTSVNGEAIKLVHSFSSNSTRRKRSVDVLTITTPDGLESGQSIMMQPLEEKDLITDYRSDSSPHFQPYIVNPDTTSDMVERLLYKRPLHSFYSFALVPIGHLSMPGPVNITLNDLVGDNDENKTALLHWNPIMQQWEITSRTCGQDSEVFNGDGTITVMICNTWSEHENKQDKSNRKKRSAEVTTPYLSTETQYILVSLSKGIYNSPPWLISSDNVTIEEDSGTLQYPLQAFDDEGEEIQFILNDSFTGYKMSEPLLTKDGILLYTPCKDCYGVESIPIILKENQSDPDIPPADTPVTVTINVIDVNDPPVMFVTQYGHSKMHSDPTEPILVYLEQMNTFNKEKWNETFTALIGAYDIDRSDSLHIEVNEPSHGNHTLTEKSTAPFDVQPCTKRPQVNNLPCGNFSHTLPYSGMNMSWIYYTISYDQAMLFSGYDEIKIYINDTHNATSNVVTIRFIIMESPCHNEGICEGKNDSKFNPYPCQYTNRAEDFDKYYRCICKPGYTGIHCESDIDECVSSPCTEPHVCYNQVNGYKCACPQDDPKCDFKPWIVAVGVMGGLMFLFIILAALYRRKVKKSGHFRWIEKHILKRKINDSLTSLRSESSEASMGDLNFGSLVFTDGKTGPFDSDANESSVDKGLILFPEKDGKAEPQKGWRRPFVSEFPLFNNASVSPEPLQPNAKPVFEPKSLEPTESDTVEGLTTAPVIMKSEGLKAKGITPDSQGRNRKPAQLEKIVHPEKSSIEGKEKRKRSKDAKEDYPENWVIPSLATAFAMPDPLKGSNRPPKFKPKRPKSNDLKNWTPQEIDLEMTTSERPASGQRPKSPYRVTEQNESSTDDQVPYSLYPDTKTPML
ncbi:uncharacterized protein LOC143084119 [Mytilus galloprovincialis]|uniref:uncharacterized protein LOC143084119 n=1 Tax=Mytilus galloprovincialis TaxID=29158 RepID=UPI003F7C672A